MKANKKQNDMKKIFTLCVALFSAVAMFAQDAERVFEFTDVAGNVVPSGSVITRNEVEEADFGGYQITTGLFAKQNLKEKDGYPVAVKMVMEVTKMPHGQIQYCYPGSCQLTLEGEDGVGTYEAGPAVPEATTQSLTTEWMMGLDDNTGEALYGEAEAKFTLVACKQIPAGTNELGIPVYDYEEIGGENPSVTVKFVNADPTGVNGVADNANATVVARYAADGSRLSAPQKGLNIVKLSNGKTIKYIK